MAWSADRPIRRPGARLGGVPIRNRWLSADSEWHSECVGCDGVFFVRLTATRSAVHPPGYVIELWCHLEWSHLIQWLRVELYLVESGFYARHAAGK